MFELLKKFKEDKVFVLNSKVFKSYLIKKRKNFSNLEKKF